MQLRPIEIDVEVYRFLESRRTSFTQTHNDILRDWAELKPISSLSSNGSGENYGAWSSTSNGVTLPNGTKLRMTYNGQTHTGEIMQGAWHVGGAVYHSPSAAAGGIARSKKGKPVSLDGWGYWEVQMPDSDKWVHIGTLRHGSKS